MLQTWTPQLTEDGSFTFFSAAFGEFFHSQRGARAEAFEKFAIATDLSLKARQCASQAALQREVTPVWLRLLDVCYGLGYNTAAALETIWAAAPDCCVEVIGLEIDPTVPLAATSPAVLAGWSPPVQAALQAIAQAQGYSTPNLAAKLLIGDARQTIQPLAAQRFQADAVLFDPFSPRRCPALWSVEFFAQVARCLAPNGKLATYSRSAAVRAAMQAAGLQIGTIPLGDRHLPHEWSQGTVAGFEAAGLQPLSPMEQEHLRTRAAVPFRDPSLKDSAAVILERQHQEQQTCGLESTSSWRRRWQIK